MRIASILFLSALIIATSCWYPYDAEKQQSYGGYLNPNMNGMGFFEDSMAFPAGLKWWRTKQVASERLRRNAAAKQLAAKFPNPIYPNFLKWVSY